VRPRRVLLADLDHLDVDRARAGDAAAHPEHLLHGGEDGQPAAIRELGQRRGGIRGADDHVIERERHSVSMASLKVRLGRITAVALSRATW
jgi:hypothetical protein